MASFELRKAQNWESRSRDNCSWISLGRRFARIEKQVIFFAKEERVFLTAEHSANFSSTTVPNLRVLSICRNCPASLNQMRHFEWMVLQNLKEKNHSENGTRYFEEIRRTRMKLILQIGTFYVYKLTGLAGQLWQMESAHRSVGIKFRSSYRLLTNYELYCIRSDCILRHIKLLQIVFKEQ